MTETTITSLLDGSAPKVRKPFADLTTPKSVAARVEMLRDAMQGRGASTVREGDFERAHFNGQSADEIVHANGEMTYGEWAEMELRDVEDAAERLADALSECQDAEDRRYAMEDWGGELAGAQWRAHDALAELVAAETR